LFDQVPVFGDHVPVTSSTYAYANHGLSFEGSRPLGFS